MSAAPKVESVTVGPFQENSYLVSDLATGRAVLIDPGDEPARIIRLVERAGVALEGIWLTHAHIDHVGAVAALRHRWDVPIRLHPADRPLYDNAGRQAAAYGLPFDPPPPPDHELADGDRLRLGDLEFEVVHTPGHAPGHCVFVGHGVMLGGDLLFAGSIGRTDLPLSDPRAMQRSLERVLGLDDALVVYPGHGPATSIGIERASNPFLTGAARPVVR